MVLNQLLLVLLWLQVLQLVALKVVSADYANDVNFRRRFMQESRINARLTRQDVIISQTVIHSLRRFKEDVAEVKVGLECGITLADSSDVKAGDIVEVNEFVARNGLLGDVYYDFDRAELTEQARTRLARNAELRARGAHRAHRR